MTYLGTPIKTRRDIPKTHMRHVRPMRGRFSHHKVTELLRSIYDEQEYAEMQKNGVDKRMMFGTNPHYQALAMGGGLCDAKDNMLVPDMPPSKPIAALILPRSAEAADMAGAKDPSNQMSYSPNGKLLHKYGEIALAYASPVCSAHCRYCYRLDLFNKDTGKSSIRPEEIRDYVLEYNDKIKKNGFKDPETGEERFPILEILLSGGDPLVLTNSHLYRFLKAIGQAGVNLARIGTKELAFRPERADKAFVDMLKIVHKEFPNLHINIVSHFTHPDEFLLRDQDNQYIPDEQGGYKWMDMSKAAIERLLSLPFVTIENQTPLIRKVNDDAESLHILHAELRRTGVKAKYIFQGRDIEGHKAFSLPIEEGWRLHNEAMKGLSDTARSRFAMSTEWGKMEITSVTDGISDMIEETVDLPDDMRALLHAIFHDGLIFIKSHRSPYSAKSQGDLIIARRNPEALWISGYEDRIIYDSRKEGPDKYVGLKIMANQLVKRLSEKKDKQQPAHAAE